MDPINLVSQLGIEPETLRFQDNHEARYGTEATVSSALHALPLRNLKIELINGADRGAGINALKLHQEYQIRKTNKIENQHKEQ